MTGSSNLEKIRSQNSWILVEAEEAPDKVGLIHIPATANLRGHKYIWGKVLSVGDGWEKGKRTYYLDEIKPGYKIMFSGILGQVDTSKGHQYLLGDRVYFVHASDIMLWVESEAAAAGVSLR